MSGLYFCEHRRNRPAFLHAVFATILEWTAMRNIQRAGGLTFDALDLFVLIHMNGKLCPQKSLCIWMKRLFRNILSLEPEILVCDEATSALDVSVQESVIRLLVRLQKEKNISMLFICHDLALIRSFAHQIAVMYLGNIVEVIPGEDVNVLPPEAGNCFTICFALSTISDSLNITLSLHFRR